MNYRSLIFYILTIITSFSVKAQQLKYVDHFKDKRTTTQDYIRNKVKISGYEKFYQNNYHFSQVVDQVYVKGSSRIYLKSGLEVNFSKRDKFLKFEGDYLYHFVKKGQHYALYFENVSPRSRKRAVNSLKRSLSRAPQFTFLNLVIPQAVAQQQESGCSGDFLNIINEKDLSSLTAPAKTMQLDFLLSSATSCVQSALTGAWDSTGGRALDIGRGFLTFIKSPIKTSKKLWKSAKETYKTTVQFMANIKEELSKAAGALSELSTQAQVDLVCGLVGNLSGTVLLGILTGGPAGMARGVLKLVSQIARFKSVAAGLRVLDKMKGALLSKGKDFKMLAEKIMNSTNEKALENFEKLGNNKFQNLTIEYALCAF